MGVVWDMLFTGWAWLYVGLQPHQKTPKEKENQLHPKYYKKVETINYFRTRQSVESVNRLKKQVLGPTTSF